MVKSAEGANFSSHVWIFGKSTAGRIGDLGRPDPARGPYFGDPWCSTLSANTYSAVGL